MSNEKAHALVLAETLMSISNGRLPESESIFAAAATELQTQHFRIKELEAHITKLTTWKNEGELEIRAWDTMKEQQREIIKLEKMLESIGAGGVSAQRITQAADHIEQHLEMVAAQEPFGYFKAEPFGWRDCAETDEVVIALYDAPQPQADARDAQRYRWLRAQPLESDNSMFCTTIWRKGTDGFGDDLRLEELDAAIDASIAAAKGAQK